MEIRDRRKKGAAGLLVMLANDWSVESPDCGALLSKYQENIVL